MHFSCSPKSTFIRLLRPGNSFCQRQKTQMTNSIPTAKSITKVIIFNTSPVAIFQLLCREIQIRQWNLTPERNRPICLLPLPFIVSIDCSPQQHPLCCLSFPVGLSSFLSPGPCINFSFPTAPIINIPSNKGHLKAVPLLVHVIPWWWQNNDAPFFWAYSFATSHHWHTYHIYQRRPACRQTATPYRSLLIQTL